jgi:hypothetical protein
VNSLHELKLMAVMQVTARAKETAAALPDTQSSPADIIATAKIPAASPTGSHGVQTATLLNVDGHAAGDVTSHRAADT